MVSKRYESKKVDPAPLGQPLHFEFANRTAPNRFMKAAMTERLSSWSPTDHAARGIPSKNLINVYKRWGEGEWGVILSGNIMIFPDQLEAAGNPIVPASAQPSGERFEAFKELITESKKHGSLYVAQVSHPGRQVQDVINDHPISASDVQLEGDIMGMTFAKPKAATKDDIQEVVDGFAHAAEYLEKAGADGIQLHGAHGYLLAQFLSQTTNQRTDEYGGSLVNRARIITDIAKAVRQRTKPNFILGIKLNSVEFQAKGFSPEESKELCALLEQERFDFVELSGGTYEELAFMHKRESTKKRESFFMEFADSIVPALSKTKAYVTGGFRTAGGMVDALKTVHGVGLARPATQDFELPKDILSGKVDATIEQVFDQNNFGLTNLVAGTQIRQVGKDQQPIDGSDPEVAKLFQKDLNTWMQGMQDNKNGEKYGYIDLDSVQPIPYGTAAAA